MNTLYKLSLYKYHICFRGHYFDYFKKLGYQIRSREYHNNLPVPIGDREVRYHDRPKQKKPKKEKCKNCKYNGIALFKHLKAKANFKCKAVYVESREFDKMEAEFFKTKKKLNPSEEALIKATNDFDKEIKEQLKIFINCVRKVGHGGTAENVSWGGGGNISVDLDFILKL